MITAIILAAGRGSRMNELTNVKPKCLLELAGKPLLAWQLDALTKAACTRKIVVRGYLSEMLTGPFETVENPRWAETNMVQTLMCALGKLSNECAIISYADIVYKSSHVEALMATKGDICITYDTQWESLWRLRNENPLDDAETFKEHNGVLLEIGKKTSSLDDIKGQYMGLIKLTSKGQNIIANYVQSLSREMADKLDMTTLLQALLQQGHTINTCAVSGGWCECDTETDIAIYTKQLQSDLWLHDWR